MKDVGDAWHGLSAKCGGGGFASSRVSEVRLVRGWLRAFLVMCLRRIFIKDV